VVSTLGLRSYTLLGISGGAAVAIAHAARHPECVSKLVLHAGFARGRSKRGPQESEMAKALVAIMREGWGDENSAFLRILSSVWFPGATSDEIKWYADLLRLSTSVENAVKHHEASNSADVVDLLKQISAPTLVLHCRHDNAAPFDGGRRLAAAIPNARFVSLDSENHMPLPREPAWQRFIDEIEAFLSD